MVHFFPTIDGRYTSKGLALTLDLGETLVLHSLPTDLGEHGVVDHEENDLGQMRKTPEEEGEVGDLFVARTNTTLKERVA